MRPTHHMIRWVLPVLLAAGMFLALPPLSSAHPAQIAVGISVGIAPPPLPYYAQPICPGEGYIWTPGYWSWDGSDYYWVPGTWVLAPFEGGLWTPGYWGWGGAAFFWHEGYWGPRVGFYGGINYGFGYGGVGYLGGEWRGGVFAYNTSVTRVDVNVIHNTYVQPVAHVGPGRVAYNGGTGGIQRQPTADERAAEGDRRAGPTAEQTQHDQVARTNPAQHFSANNGKPAVAATTKAGDFSHGAQPSATRPAYRPSTSSSGTMSGGNTGHSEGTTSHTSTTHTTTTTHTATTSHTSAPHSSAPPHSSGGGESHGGGGGAGGGGHDKPGH